MYKAAAVDGASRWQSLHVPCHCSPVILVVLLRIMDA
jgi:ABC-type polysaccharide transport system permease subunit